MHLFSGVGAIISKEMPGLALFGRNRLRYGIAFGERFLLAARLSPGQSERSLDSSRCQLPPDLVSVSSVEPNFRSASQLARLAGDALLEVGCSGGPVAVVLPDLAIRSFVFHDGKRLASRDLLDRMVPQLSYPPNEAMIDTWRAPAGWVLAAAVRRVVLHQYEQALEALGCHVAWVDGASLARIPAWSAEAMGSGGLRVHVQLYPGHYTLTIFRKSNLMDVRTRLRYAVDEQKVVEDLVRIPSLYEGEEEFHQVSVRGEGAAAVVDGLERASLARDRLELGEEGEEAHLESLVEILIRRGAKAS